MSSIMICSSRVSNEITSTKKYVDEVESLQKDLQTDEYVTKSDDLLKTTKVNKQETRLLVVNLLFS